MKKWVSFFFVWTILAVFLLGCAGNLKDTKIKWIKCPKCGAFFSTKEGAEEFERMRADPYR